MAEFSPSRICKGSLFNAIDQVLSHPKRESLDALRSGGSMFDFGVQLGLVDDSLRQHAEVEFLGNGSGAWWPEFAHKAEIVRAGYIRAYELALESSPPRPIATFWVRGLSTFECIVSDSQTQIELFLVTPDPPVKMPPAHRDESLWLVASRDRIDEVRDAFVRGSEIEAPEDSGVHPEIAVQRLRSA